jgi:hypothetical protein
MVALFPGLQSQKPEIMNKKNPGNRSINPGLGQLPGKTVLDSWLLVYNQSYL